MGSTGPCTQSGKGKLLAGASIVKRIVSQAQKKRAQKRDQPSIVLFWKMEAQHLRQTVGGEGCQPGPASEAKKKGKSISAS